MTHTDDRPTIAERYQRATQSSNLEVEERRKGDVDHLIAAGWVSESLGTMLYRLVGEFDSIKGEHGLAEAEIQRARGVIEAKLDAARKEQDADKAEQLRQQAADLRKESERATVTARALILMRLKTLHETKEALGRFAVVLATRRNIPEPDAWVLKLTGRVLDVFLDPTCHSCDGRGFNGGTHRGEKTVICRACSGSGKRRTNLGKDAVERHFAGMLLVEMDRLLGHVDAEMRRFLRTHAK